jgi:hypothetical protein
LNISVQEAEKLSLEEIRRFVEAREAIRFAGEANDPLAGRVAVSGSAALGEALTCGNKPIRP